VISHRELGQLAATEIRIPLVKLMSSYKRGPYHTCVIRPFISSLLLADDHPVVRDGIHNQMDREEDFSVVGEAATGEEPIRQLRRTRPDVVLLDVPMPAPVPVPVMEALRPR
jgi:PleD family two-component response regulator